MTAPRRLRRGDRYLLPPPPPEPIRVEVIRVAEDGAWIDLEVTWYGATWRRRRPLPLSPEYVPVSAEVAAVLADSDAEWPGPALDSDVESADSGAQS